MMKVMIVDDEKDIEVVLRQRFRKEVKEGRVELCYAFSGDEALEMLSSVQPPDVVCILSDINMPGMTGLELLKIVKERFPQIRVSIITAYGYDQNYKTSITPRPPHTFSKTYTSP